MVCFTFEWSLEIVDVEFRPFVVTPGVAFVPKAKASQASAPTIDLDVVVVQQGVVAGPSACVGQGPDRGLPLLATHLIVAAVEDQKQPPKPHLSAWKVFSMLTKC